MAKSSTDLIEIKNFIATLESIGDYNIYNINGGRSIRSSTPGSPYFNQNSVILTNLTLKQVLENQSPHIIDGKATNPLGKGNLFATGKYQIVPGTLYTAVKTLNIFDKKYDQTTQEQLGDYLILDKRSDTGKYIRGTNGGSKEDLERAIQGLGQEFASFPIITRSGKTWGNVETGDGNKAYYGGDGVNPDKSKYTVKDVAKKLIKARIAYSEKNPSYIPSYADNITSASPASSPNTITGKITDDKGQPVAGAKVIIEPPKEYPDTPFKNSTESDEFRTWLLEKYPEYKNSPKPYNVDPPPQPNSINTKALKKAWDEKGEEYISTAPSPILSPEEYIADGCSKKCDPGVVFSKVPPDLDSFFTLMGEKFNKCSKGCPDVINNLLKEKGSKVLSSLPTGNIYLYFRDNEGPIRGYSAYYNRYIKSKESDPQNNELNDQLKEEVDFSELVLKDANVILEYFKAPWSFDYGPNKPTQILKSPDAPDNVTETVTDKDGNFTLKPDIWDPTGTVTVSKEGHEVKELTNIQQTGGDTLTSDNKEYNIPRLTLSPTPDVTNTAINKINQEIGVEETNQIKQQGESELTAQEKFANTTNRQKEELKKTAIPFVVKLLAQFGGVALQAILSKVSLNKIEDQISCPSQAKLLELINKRNKLTRQINIAYKTVTITSKILLGINATITALQAGITAIEFSPIPATTLTSGAIEITGTSKDKLKDALKKAKVVINISTLALSSFGIILGIILRLLNNLDTLIQQCSNEQDVPFEAINDELNIFVNQSTGISNSGVIQGTQQDVTYREFKLEIKLDASNSNKYPKRFAQALNKQGIPVLKTESSFASDAQVLLDQLKFIIDSNPQLTAG